jgi:hypothetical protein
MIAFASEHPYTASAISAGVVVWTGRIVLGAI